MTLLLVLPGPLRAQSQAAVIDIHYDTVEIRRGGTDAWLPLRAGALAPIGAGDRIRTNDAGRALITAGGAASYLLPNTDYTLMDYADDAIHTRLHSGQVTHRIREAAAFTVETPTATFDLTPGPRLNVIMTARERGTDYLLVAQGTARVGQRELTQGDALANTEDGPAYLRNVAPPLNPARVDGLLYGCAGTVETEGAGQDLNTRAGPSTDNPTLGLLVDGQAVQVMGLVASGGWYRVQFRGGFGWVTRLAVTDIAPGCALPTLPDDSFDVPNRVLNIAPAEQAYLEPFYGLPADDPFFYQRDGAG